MMSICCDIFDVLHPRVEQNIVFLHFLLNLKSHLLCYLLLAFSLYILFLPAVPDVRTKPNKQNLSKGGVCMSG